MHGRIRADATLSCSMPGAGTEGPETSREEHSVSQACPSAVLQQARLRTACGPVRPSQPQILTSGRLVAPMSSTRRSAREGSMPSIWMRISVLRRRMDSCSPWGGDWVGVGGWGRGSLEQTRRHPTWSDRSARKQVLLSNHRAGGAQQPPAGHGCRWAACALPAPASTSASAGGHCRRSPSDFRADSSESTSSMKMTEGATWAATANSARTWPQEHGRGGRRSGAVKTPQCMRRDCTQPSGYWQHAGTLPGVRLKHTGQGACTCRPTPLHPLPSRSALQADRQNRMCWQAPPAGTCQLLALAHPLGDEGGGGDGEEDGGDVGGDGLAQHRLAGAGGPKEQDALGRGACTLGQGHMGTKEGGGGLASAALLALRRRQVCPRNRWLHPVWLCNSPAPNMIQAASVSCAACPHCEELRVLDGPHHHLLDQVLGCLLARNVVPVCRASRG